MSENAIYTQPQPLTIKEYQGQRVVTFKDIDMLHKRPEGTADRNFRENQGCQPWNYHSHKNGTCIHQP